MTQLYDAKYFSSRLLGQNRFFAEAGAVIDVAITENNEAVAKLFAEQLENLLAVLPVKDYAVKVKVYSSGFNIAIRYPYDLLMVACEMLDWVWVDVTDLIDIARPIDLVYSRKKFRRLIAENQQPLLRKIYAKARQKQVNFFIHKDILVLGSGIAQFRSKLNKILKLNAIPWGQIADIPTLLITGTNGKTTTTRLTEFICRRGAGLKSGYCSTDWVMINGKRVSEGDLSGPTGHQFVLTSPKVEVAILEVARGGIIKRGLLPNYVSAATVTNVAYDHIGQSGINNLTDLAEAKGIVYSALNAKGIAIINLDDEQICQLKVAASKAYLSTKLAEDVISTYLTEDNFVVFIAQSHIVIKTPVERLVLNDLLKVPLTVNGLARYNYENILHAVALAYSLGLSAKQIMRGLSRFAADEKSNFGRWNYYNLPKYGHLVVDIAHNPAGLESILTLAADFRSLHRLDGKLGLMYGNTADRREAIPEVVKIILRHKVDEVVIKEFQTSLRGSELGEMPEIFRLELLKQGYPPEKIRVIPNELEAVKAILSQIKANDLFMLCSHEQLSSVSKLLGDKLAE